MIVVVRHGRTAANAGGLLLGRADPPLDAEGDRQAAALGAACADLDLARVVTSPLGRCRATAGAIAAAAGGVPVAVDERWIELDYGELDGVPFADLPAELWSAWRADIEWCPPGGESLAALGRRVRAGADALADEARDRDVVVVSHVSPIKAAVSYVLGAGPETAWRSHLDPASISRITISPRGAVLRTFNETWHLAGVRAEA